MAEIKKIAILEAKSLYGTMLLQLIPKLFPDWQVTVFTTPGSLSISYNGKVIKSACSREFQPENFDAVMNCSETKLAFDNCVNIYTCSCENYISVRHAAGIALDTVLACWSQYEIASIVATVNYSLSHRGKKTIDLYYHEIKNSLSIMDYAPKAKVLGNLDMAPADENEYSDDEQNILKCIKKYNCKIALNAVQVPVPIGDAIFVTLQFNKKPTKKALLAQLENLEYSDNFVNPIDVLYETTVFVSRIHIEDNQYSCVLSYDNLRLTAMEALKMAEDIASRR